MLEGLTLSPEMIAQLQADIIPIIAYGVFIVIYGVIIWHYYRTLAKRDIFTAKMEEGTTFAIRLRNFIRGLSVLLGYVVIFPLISALWFGILFVFLTVLAKARPVESVLVISIAIVFATRIAAYYNEDLAKDLAKLIPFALLAVFIVDPSFFSIGLAIERLYSIPQFWMQILEAVLLVVVLEWALKILYTIKVVLFGERKEKKAEGKEEEAPEPKGEQPEKL